MEILWEKSTPIEHLAAVLTAVCLWWVWRDFTRGGRKALRQLGGEPLLTVFRSNGTSPGCDLYVLPLMAGIGALVTQSALAVFVFVLSGLCVIGDTRALGNRVQLRERGMVLARKAHGWGCVALVPYRMVRYCQWVKARARLRVQLWDTREDCSIIVRDPDAFTRVLARYVEVRDAEGRPLEVEAEPLPTDRPDPHEFQHAEPDGVVYPFRTFQFTLRTLMIAVVAASAGASWFGIRCGQSREQQQGALARLEPFGPAVSWDALYVRELDFSSSAAKPGSASLIHLKEFPGLERLNLHGAEVTDAGLRYLSDLEELEFLDLSGTRVTDAGLAELYGLRRLKRLCLRDTLVTDQGVADLRKALPAVDVDR